MKSVSYWFYESLILEAVEVIAEEFIASSSGIISEWDVEDAVAKELFLKGRIYTDFSGDQAWMAGKAFFDDSLFDMVVKHYGTGWQPIFFSKKNAKERAEYLNEFFAKAMYLEKYDERKQIIHNIMRRVSKEN